MTEYRAVDGRLMCVHLYIRKVLISFIYSQNYISRPRLLKLGVCVPGVPPMKSTRSAKSLLYSNSVRLGRTVRIGWRITVGCVCM